MHALHAVGKHPSQRRDYKVSPGAILEPDAAVILARLQHGLGNPRLFLAPTKSTSSAEGPTVTIWTIGFSRVRGKGHAGESGKASGSPRKRLVGRRGLSHVKLAAEALRWSADAVLYREHADQSRGERRRSLLHTLGTGPDSGPFLLVVSLTANSCGVDRYSRRKLVIQ
jgi:hypothetical protein